MSGGMPNSPCSEDAITPMNAPQDFQLQHLLPEIFICYYMSLYDSLINWNIPPVLQTIHNNTSDSEVRWAKQILRYGSSNLVILLYVNALVLVFYFMRNSSPSPNP